MMQSMGAIPVAGNTTVEASAVHHALGVSKNMMQDWEFTPKR